MNRERLLLVSILGILALWYLLMREEPKIVQSAQPQRVSLKRAPVRSAAYPVRAVSLAEPYGAFKLVTNVVDYPRPDLPGEVGRYLETEMPRPFPIPNIWPPTSRSLAYDKLGRLRRPAPAPGEEPATLVLPELPAEVKAAAGAERERVDLWRSFKNEQRGRVTEITVQGKRLAEPSKLPDETSLAALTGEHRFWYFLALIEVDPDRARDEGVTEIRAQIAGLAPVRQKLGEEMTDFQVGGEGQHRGFLIGVKRALRRGEGVDAHYQLGRELLQQGVQDGDLRLVDWALWTLGEAKAKVPAAGAQQVLRKILLLMLDAASRLNRQELVLQLAFEHLATFPGEEEVLEYVGNICASRSFNLLDFAAQFFELARNSPYAQRRLVEVLVRLSRFDEAQAILESGRTGGGPEVDLLRARVALALGDLSTAENRARRQAGAADAVLQAEAHQILGAVAYAGGDASGAEQHFLQAVQADPRRSTAYSDLGLAAAVQGRAADARLCFERALTLDRIDNIVTPSLGDAWLELAAGDAALRAAGQVEEDARAPEAAERRREELRSTARSRYQVALERLNTLQENNPTEMVVRYMLAYAKEKAGTLEEAASLYRSTIDADYRWRIAIARLGHVQAKLVEAGGSRDLGARAVAHLKKAVALNPQDALLPYALGRFLLLQRLDHQLADKSFAEAQKLDVNEANGNLPLWAQFARACLAYRDPREEERRVKARLNELLDRIKDLHPPGTPPAELLKHEVYRAATIALEVVKETETKVNKTWDFLELATRPPDWTYNNRNPMRVSVARAKGLLFGGEIDYGGKARDDNLVLESCSSSYKSGDLNGNTFYELQVEGFIPDTRDVEFGVGLVNEGRGKTGPTGIQVRRKARTGNVEIKLDGGEHQRFKNVRGDYVEMPSVPWPAGQFRLHILVEPEYGQARSQGRFRLMLNDVNVFERELGQKSERSSIFGRGRSNMPIVIYVWVEGSEGMVIPEIQVRRVLVTMAKK